MTTKQKVHLTKKIKNKKVQLYNKVKYTYWCYKIVINKSKNDTTRTRTRIKPYKYNREIFKKLNEEINENYEKLLKYKIISKEVKSQRNKIKLMSKLIKIQLPSQKLKNLEIIKYCINLQELWCSGNKITSIQGLENCINLQELQCNNNQITNLQGLENCINLQ